MFSGGKVLNNRNDKIPEEENPETDLPPLSQDEPSDGNI